ncbi:MAG: efflux RND transporter periplasmic adaptor subunit [Deltaproteobacteria bacterium]|nr:efflux RND transporter periplasmic adaptor subunit [Deltaproteobacteria bacterium]
MSKSWIGAGCVSALRVLWLLASVGLLFGCGGDDPARQGPPMQMPKVGVVEMKPRDVLTTVDLTGRVAPHATAEVRPQVNGIILKRMFEEGSNVKSGQQLYQINPSVYQAQYENAVASRKKAETALNNARRIMDRYAEIIKVNGVSRQEYDNAQSQHRAAEADLASADAALKSARINLDYTKVLSPVSGRVGISNFTEGALVTAGQPTPLVAVQQMDPMYIDITQSSADFLRLQRNLQSGALAEAEENAVGVKLVLEDGLPYEHEARMMLYDATVSKSTGAITMRATVRNPSNLLLPGMFVRAVVAEGITRGALLVPLGAVQRTPRGEAAVLIVNAQNQVEQRIIQSSRIYNNAAWIVLPGKNGPVGLEAGDKIILEGVNRVRPGVPAETYPVPMPGLPEEAGSTEAAAQTAPPAGAGVQNSAPGAEGGAKPGTAGETPQ